MKGVLKLLLHLGAFVVFTVVTQIGGLIYLISYMATRRYQLQLVGGSGVFIALYLFATFIIAPVVAPMFGRVPLPLTGELRPLNKLTCLLNRHYVTPALREQLGEVAKVMAARYEGSVVNYLDAGFPFFDGFPLFPHLSHSDGKKIDLAFVYLKDGDPTNSAPSLIGYGGNEAPTDTEPNYPEICRQQGHWQYNLISALVPQRSADRFEVDITRTRALIILLARHDLTSKIFIEPHLKERWRLKRFDNIRFHGCQAVRHDDHIHTQIR